MKKKNVFMIFFAFSLLTTLSLQTTASVSQIHSEGWRSSDSTSVQKAERDLQELKGHVSLTKAQEEVVYRVILGHHLYLEDLEPVGERWKLTLQANIARFRKELGEESFLRLEDKGLVKKWFGFDQ